MSNTPELSDVAPTEAQAEVEDAKVGSIRNKILRSVLPIVMLPLLVLSAIAIFGAVLIQNRTSEAVSSAEAILSDEVVAAGADRAADTSAREVAEFIDQLILRTDRLTNDSSFAEDVILASQEAEGTTNVLGSVSALDAARRITVAEEDLQVVLVDGAGRLLGSTHEDTTLDDYSGAPWLTETLDSGQSFRGFVDDGEHVPSLELALFIEPTATVDGSAVIRVRVPISNVQAIVDQLATEGGVQIGIVDNTTAESVILADTSIDHDPAIVFRPDQIQSPDSGLNVEAMTADAMAEEGGASGTSVEDDVITATRTVADLQDNNLNLSAPWVIQTNQSAEIATESLADIREVSDTVDEQRGLVFITVGILLVLAAFFAVVAIRTIAGSITAPVAQLSEQARVAAQEGIPAVVEAARTSERLPELPAFEVDSDDELSQLAESLNTMQGAAVDLAAGQAKLRRQNVARTFVSLGRRNQNLLNRQLEFIDELERQESDPDTLENLFRLDHLATRMRRNAENLLVLAGEQTPRRWGKPIAVRDVIRAAAAEIADYRRVKLGQIEPATVSGNLATDLSHVVAELLENAGSFSPPNTTIEVLGQMSETHYRLAIVDQGIGMDDRAMGEANDRLKNPVDFADAPSAYLGLFVVGRLSQDLGITVRLASADPSGEGQRRGTIAFVDLPVGLLSKAAANPIDIDNRDARGQAASVVEANETVTASDVLPTAPAASEAPPAPQREPVVAATEISQAPHSSTTAAGFPKRTKSNSADTPAQTAPVAPADPGTTPEPQPAAAVASVPVVPVAPDNAVTAAGFPKRSRTKSEDTATAAPGVPPTPDLAEPTPRRSADEVSNSLRSFRAAVARGRQASQEASAPEAVPTAPAQAAPIAPQTQVSAPAPQPQPQAAPTQTAPTSTAPAQAAPTAPQTQVTAPAPQPPPQAAPTPTAPAQAAPAAPAMPPADIAAPIPPTSVTQEPPVTAPITPVAAAPAPVAPSATPSKMAPPVVETTAVPSQIHANDTVDPSGVQPQQITREQQQSPTIEIPSTTGSET